MKTPELGFGGSNSAYNLEKGPRVRAQPFGTRGPLRRAAPRRAGAARRHLPREVRQPGVTPLSKAGKRQRRGSARAAPSPRRGALLSDCAAGPAELDAATEGPLTVIPRVSAAC